MPGICGFTSSELINSPNILSQMLESMKHFPWQQIEQDSSAEFGLGRVSLGILNTSPQPVRDNVSDSALVLDGEIYNAEAVLTSLPASSGKTNGMTQAEILLQGYLDHGTKFFSKIDGKFSAAIWDNRKKQMLLVNDCFGMKPLYYTHSGNWFGFASEIKTLLLCQNVSSSIDVRGLSQFFSFGHYWNNETSYESIKALPGGSVITFDTEQNIVRKDRYFQFESSQNQSASGESGIELITSAFKSAVDCRSLNTDHLGISLSGGLDARTILGSLNLSQVQPTSICLGIEGSLDHRSSSQLASLAGSDYHAYTLNDAFLADFESHLRRMVLLTDGHYLSQCIVMPTLPFYRELGIEVLLRGHGGELMHLMKAYNFSLDQEAQKIHTESELHQWLFSHLRAYMLDQVDTQLFAEIDNSELNSLANETLTEALTETEDWPDQLQRLSHLFVSQRLRRETSMSLVKIGSYVETRLPYIDRDVVQTLLSLPTRLKLGEDIQAHILAKYFPQFLNVTNVNTGAKIGASPVVRKLSYYRMRILAKLGVKGYQPYERLGLWLRRELKPVVKNILLGDRCLSRGLFRPEAVKRVVQQHFDNERNHTFLLMAMMISELGQEMFIDGTVKSTEFTS